MEDKKSVEESFRSSLEDVIAISHKLIPYCHDLTEMEDMLKLALTNDAQLKLLMKIVLEQQGKSR